MTEQQAADQVWDALMKLSEIAARSRHQQRELYPLIRQIVDAVVARGVRAPGTGLFVPCPVCNAMVGQRCITIPGHILHDSIHPERVELCKETIGR